MTPHQKIQRANGRALLIGLILLVVVALILALDPPRKVETEQSYPKQLTGREER